jgi:hypothetical protein
MLKQHVQFIANVHDHFGSPTEMNLVVYLTHFSSLVQLSGLNTVRRQS